MIRSSVFGIKKTAKAFFSSKYKATPLRQLYRFDLKIYGSDRLDSRLRGNDEAGILSRYKPENSNNINIREMQGAETPRHFRKCPGAPCADTAEKPCCQMVGPAGFEPATSTAPWWRATGLRYGPSFKIYSVIRETSKEIPSFQN